MTPMADAAKCCWPTGLFGSAPHDAAAAPAMLRAQISQESQGIPNGTALVVLRGPLVDRVWLR